MTAFIIFSSLVVPVVIWVMGMIFEKNPPKNINGSVGYRTKRSRSSQEAWDYSNKRMAEIMHRSGAIMIIVTVAVMAVLVFGIKLSENALSTALVFVMLLQVAVIIAFSAVIEKELKEKFDI